MPWAHDFLQDAEYAAIGEGADEVISLVISLGEVIFWANYNDLNEPPKPIDDGLLKGNHPLL